MGSKQDAVQDPVCGMRFPVDQAATSVTWRKRTFYFCCETCARTFQKDPRRFLQREPEAMR